MIIFSPLEQFEVINLISIYIPVFGYINLSLTNLGFYTIITIFIVLILHILSNNNKLVIPNRWSISIESNYISVNNIVKSQIGNKNQIFFPFIYCLFFFILSANLNGNVPYGYTITTSIIISIGISITIFIGVTILGLQLHKIHFFSFFVPSGTPLILVPLLVPIELISYLARAFSLGVRLFANVTAGHVLIKILAGFLAPIFITNIIIFVLTLLPFIIFIGILSLEIAVSFIQRYVFCVLTCSYLKDAIDLH
jgi:F-type H+-transporting ATPase subunit a